MHSGSFGKRFVKGKKRVSAEFSTALSKISAVEIAGSTMDRNVSFRFLALIYDP